MSKCKRNRAWLAALAVGLMLSGTVLGNMNLIVNGSFEEGVGVPISGYLGLATGSTAITGWTVVSGSVDWIGNYWQASDGTHSIDLSGTTLGALEVFTNVSLQQGQRYLLTFDMAGNPDGPPDVKVLDVKINDALASTFFFDKTGKTKTNMGWTPMSLEFVATASGPTKLGFASGAIPAGVNPYYGPAIDNVRLIAIPAPGAAFLAFFGLGIVGWVKRRMA